MRGTTAVDTCECDPPHVGMLSGVKSSLYGRPHLMRDIKNSRLSSVRADTQLKSDWEVISSMSLTWWEAWFNGGLR